MKFKLNYLIIPLITIVTALTGSWFTSVGMWWYATIRLPGWTPPGSVIGAVWTVIFLLATVSVLLVWNKISHKNPKFDLIVVGFLLNALLNIFWSDLFFYQHQIGPAVIEAAVLGLSVLGLIILIYPLSQRAAWLLAPYALWVIFATYLTFSVWRLN